jgi:hypothetical protein
MPRSFELRRSGTDGAFIHNEYSSILNCPTPFIVHKIVCNVLEESD